MARKITSKRKTNPIFYVFCEGKTEKLYVEHLSRIYSTKLKPIRTTQGITSDIINRNLEVKQFDQRKDKVFLMYDLDVDSMNKKLFNIEAVLLGSNPCIELWFLLHFRDQTRNISSNTCKNKELQKKYSENYVPGKPFPISMKKQLESAIHDACERAKKLNFPSNPSSSVYRLIEALNE